MGNYYRSRLAEELALHYAAQYGLEIEADSGGLSKIPNPEHPGSIAHATLTYLANKNVQPQQAHRFPKACVEQDVQAADIVVCTDANEQMELFKRAFPNYEGVLLGWGARDYQFDTWLETPAMIDKQVEDLIRVLLEN